MRSVFLDDGDINTFFFADGIRTEAQLIDGNDDELWVARRGLFDELGRITDTIDIEITVPILNP